MKVDSSRSRHALWSLYAGQLWIGGILLSAAGCSQLQVHMPNTGITANEYTHVQKVEVVAEPAASLLGGGLVDKVAGEAAKILAKFIDTQLERLQEKFEGAYSHVYPLEGSFDPVGDSRRYHWTFVRGVRFPADKIDDKAFFEPGLSKPVKAFFTGMGDADELNPAVEADRIKHGWFENVDGEKIYQFVTMHIEWDTIASADGSAFRIERPHLRIFASEALLPRWDEIQREIRKSTDQPIIGRISELADKALVDELSLRVSIAITLEFPNDDGELVTVGSFAGTIKGVWPADTTVADDGSLRPAFDETIEDFDSTWLSNAGKNYNVRVNVTETSRVVDWIEQARQALGREAGKLLD